MRIPANFLLMVIDDRNEQFQTIFDVLVIGETDSPSILVIGETDSPSILVIGETDSPSTTIELQYFSILNS